MINELLKENLFSVLESDLGILENDSGTSTHKEVNLEDSILDFEKEEEKTKTFLKKKYGKNTALIATDLHIKPEHIEINKILLSKIIQKVKDLKPKYLFLLGDIFHFKDRLWASCLSVFLEFLEEITLHCEVICLVGNHDWGAGKPYTVHSLDSFSHIKNFRVVNDYFKLDENNGFISYCREKERLDELRAKLGPVKRLYGHLDINDFSTGSGWEETHSHTNADDFNGYEQVISGHLHLAQEKKNKNGTEIIFVGTGATTDFGESDQVKSFIFIDIDNGVWERINTGMTLHKTFRIKSNEAFPEIPLEEIANGVKFRVVVSGTKEGIATMIKPVKYPAQILYEFTSQEISRADLQVSDNRKETLNKYVDFEIKKSFKDNDSIDKEKLIKKGEEILNRFS